MKLRTVNDLREAWNVCNANERMDLSNVVVDFISERCGTASKLLNLTTNQLQGEKDLDTLVHRSAQDFSFCNDPLEYWINEKFSDPLCAQLDSELKKNFDRCEPRTICRANAKLSTALGLWGTAVLQCRTVGKFSPCSLVISSHLWRESVQGLINGIDGVSMMPEEACAQVKRALVARFNLSLMVCDDMDPWPATWAALVGPKTSVAVRGAPSYAIMITGTGVQLDASLKAKFFNNIPYAIVTF